jgi:ATP-dependent DNA ligase
MSRAVLEHVAARGRDLFRVACERDLEGIVGKCAHGTYHSEGRSTSWLKIKNAAYSQMEGRHELFEPAIGARRGFRAKLPLELRL